MTTIDTTQGVRAVQASTVEATEGGSALPADLLPQPTAVGLGGDSMTALAALITQADQQDSAAARKLQDEADSAAVDQEDQRVAQMNDKATQDEAQGLATGIGDVLGGVATGVGGFLPGASGGSGDAKADASSVDGRSIAAGLGKVLSGTGTIVAAPFKGGADRDDAQAAKFEAGAQLALRQYDEAHGEQQAADASVQKVAQFLQTLQQSQAESRSAAASMLKG